MAQPDEEIFESSGPLQAAGSHQTISRVVRILEEVVYQPGSTYAEITRAVGAPKSSVYGFIRGLLSVDWLIDQDHRLYLGPAFYSLAIASGHVRAGMVAPGDLDKLYQDTGLTAFVGVLAGEHLIYIAEAGSDLMASFEARTDIRRRPLATAGGKALLAFMPEDGDGGVLAPLLHRLDARRSASSCSRARASVSPGSRSGSTRSGVAPASPPSCATRRARPSRR